MSFSPPPYTLDALLTEGAETIERARAACAHSRMLRAHQIALMIERLERRGRRRLHGGRDLDAASLTQMLIDLALCADCVASKTGIPRADVDAALKQVAGTLQITASVGRCGACLTSTVVYRLC